MKKDVAIGLLRVVGTPSFLKSVLLVASVAILLKRYDLPGDLVIGVNKFDDGNLQNSERQSLLPIIIPVDEGHSIASILQEVKVAMGSAYRHQYCTGTLLQEAISGPGLSSKFVAPVGVLYESVGSSVKGQTEHILDIAFNFREFFEGLGFVLEYNTDLFELPAVFSLPGADG